MSNVAASFIEQRAQVLAMVQFTSRPDLQVSDLPDDSGLDLLVRISSGSQGYQNFFGVQLKGTNRALSSEDEASRYLRNLQNKKSSKPFPKYSFPVIVLLFSMENDRGYFAWLLEPIVVQTAEPRLKRPDPLACSEFDRSTLAGIVDRVNEWHDRLFVLLEKA